MGTAGRGKNAIEIASAIIDGLKRIWISPTEQASIKMTQLHAGGTATNIIPANATFSIDARAQTNATMEILTSGFEKVITAVSMMYDVSIPYQVDAHVAAAQVDDTAKMILKEAIIDVIGEENCAQEVITPGGEDFHFYTFLKPQLKTTMLGIGCGVTPGLHHPNMVFNQDRLSTSSVIITRALVLTLEYLEKGEKL